MWCTQTVQTVDVMVSVLPSSVVYHGFESWSGQTIDYEIGICCFSAKHIEIRRKSKYGLVLNQDNVSELGNMSICGLLFQWASTIKIQLSVWVGIYQQSLTLFLCTIHLIIYRFFYCRILMVGKLASNVVDCGFWPSHYYLHFPTFLFQPFNNDNCFCFFFSQTYH